MLLFEMILLWVTLFFIIILICSMINGADIVILTLVAVTLITMYITLIRYQPVIRDSVVIG